MLQINLTGQHLISHDKITKSDMHYDDIKDSMLSNKHTL